MNIRMLSSDDPDDIELVAEMLNSIVTEVNKQQKDIIEQAKNTMGYLMSIEQT